MSKDDALWADELLRRARAATAPTRADATRNFAGLEARLGMSPSASTTSPEPRGAAREGGEAVLGPGEDESALDLLGAARDPRGPEARGPSVVSGARAHGLPFAAKLGLVLSFGLTTGVVGYWLGRAETERARAQASLGMAPASIVAAPTAATPRAAPIEAAEAHDTVDVEVTSREQAGEHASAGRSAAPAQVSRATPSMQSKARAARRGDASQAAPASSRAEPRVLATRSVASSATPQTTSAALDLREALDLLRRAEAAVRRSEGLDAMLWLTELERRAAPELLIEERLVTKVLAECLLAEVDAATRTAQELERVNATSMYRSRLEGSCVVRPR